MLGLDPSIHRGTDGLSAVRLTAVPAWIDPRVKPEDDEMGSPRMTKWEARG
jgi:hypothetical protein